LQNGYNIVILSSASSGKTLAFNIPILDTLMKDGVSTALYLYPTKALAQDQFEKLKNLADCTIGTYDSDTGREERIFLRKKGRIIIAIQTYFMLVFYLIISNGDGF